MTAAVVPHDLRLDDIDEPRVRHVEHVMGTAVSFDLRPGDVPAATVARALLEACRLLHGIDATFSPWRTDSEVSRMQTGALALADACPEVHEVVARCEHARLATGGWFDPWGFGAGFDPTGLVKGWAAERALGVLEGAGLRAAMVNAGGDVATFGTATPEGRPWRIGVRDPRDASLVACRVASPGAVATSGSYERGEHVRNVRTGRSARALLSATVTGPDLALADAFATALLAVGTPGLRHVDEAPGYEAFVIEPDLTPRATASFPFDLA
jgi:thiamine biosynthesis lipoprotein